MLEFLFQRFSDPSPPPSIYGKFDSCAYVFHRILHRGCRPPGLFLTDLFIMAHFLILFLLLFQALNDLVVTLRELTLTYCVQHFN
jgi:hypothetical protein